MFGLGIPEIGIILLVVVVIFGPQKIPELGKALGKTLRGFKDEMAKNDPHNGVIMGKKSLKIIQIEKK